MKNVAPQEFKVSQKSQELGKLVNQVSELLAADKPQKALDLLVHARLNSPWVANAIAVCHMRLGDPQRAIDIYRSLVLGAGGIVVRRDVPTVFRTNYATALLLANNVSGCMSIIRDLDTRDHPSSKRLNDAVARWSSSLPFWTRIGWYLGGEPKQPVSLDFPPGEVE